MHQSCKSCGARYVIPDDKVERAGSSGLRVRCARCRAIMVVTAPLREGALIGFDDGPRPETLIAQAIDSAVDEDTKPDLPENRRSRRSSSRSSTSGLEELSGANELPGVEPPAPAVLSGSGIYRPLPGVERNVTGLHLAAGVAQKRVWYAAISGRPRGPFSEDEMLVLAREGKVRGSSLVWRPGFSGWIRVRSREAERDLTWLRRAVMERKRQERRAVERAEQKLGIHRLQLGDGASLRRPDKTPPPLPIDALDEWCPPAREESVDRVIGEPTPPGRVLSRPYRRPSPWPHRLKMFSAGVLAALLGLVLALYTVPELRRALEDGPVAASGAKER